MAFDNKKGNLWVHKQLFSFKVGCGNKGGGTKVGREGGLY